uniref:GntR family transcriptional regulator n=1 Tax=Roseovarius indicus TaxID=540747 RepID=UPI003B51D207
MFESLAPVKRETLQSIVHTRLCNLILEGELAPGESVTVASIAKALDVSPMPVRDAISRLMALGALTVVSGRSIGVPLLDLDELDDMLRVRLQVEAMAVRWAAENVDEAFLASLEKILEAMETAEAKDAVKDFIRSNYDFHFTIYRQAASPLLLQLISNIWLRINPHFHLLHRHGHYRASNRQHRKMFEALKSRDGEQAVAALREDIESAYKVIFATLSEGGAAG